SGCLRADDGGRDDAGELRDHCPRYHDGARARGARVSRPRLMLIISSSALGGAELTFRHLVQFVDVDRYDVCAVTPPWPDVANLTRTRGIEHVVLALGGRPRIGIARALGRVMKRWRPDIVHSQLLNGDVYAALAGRGVRFRRPASTAAPGDRRQPRAGEGA